MKTIQRILFTITIVFIFQSVIGQTYTIPWAQQQPAWVFPLWFEDANGDRDTIYFSYDPMAGDPWNPAFDTIFGEIPFVLDTSKFQAYLECYFDSTLLVAKSITFGTEGILNPTSGIHICFFNVKLPLILKWDPKKFYSYSLPFEDQFPAPKVQGNLGSDIPLGVDGCSYQYPIYMTDTTLGINSYLPACAFSDSVIFGGYGASYLLFQIEKWLGEFTVIESVPENNIINFFYDPGANSFLLQNTGAKSYSFNLINSIGRYQDFGGSINSFSSQTYYLPTLPNGFYLLILKNEVNHLFFKIIKL
jgi:hypothetical protein